MRLWGPVFVLCASAFVACGGVRLSALESRDAGADDQKGDASILDAGDDGGDDRADASPDAAISPDAGFDGGDAGTIEHPDGGDAGPDAGEETLDGGSDGGTDAGEQTPDGGSDAGVVIVDPDAGLPDCGGTTPTVQSGPDPGMVLVPAGPFWQGCNAAIDAQCNANEYPGRCVTLSTYEIDANPVTQAQFASFLADAGDEDVDFGVPGCDPDTSEYYHPDTTPDWPMVCVYWWGATLYCQWAGERLPTEAEYEKAARGVQGQLYPWGDGPPTCDLANYYGCTGNYTNVGSLPAGNSPYGATDSTSNVAEFVYDFYDPAYYTYAPDTNPTGPDCWIDGGPSFLMSCPGNGPVVRGYFWSAVEFSSPAAALRTSERGSVPGIPLPSTGFRCARSLQ